MGEIWNGFADVALMWRRNMKHERRVLPMLLHLQYTYLHPFTNLLPHSDTPTHTSYKTVGIEFV